jgi:hypothetical protein
MNCNPANEEALRLINEMARARRADLMVKMLPFFIFGFAI